LQIAAARCSESQLFAVPGSPMSRSARSVASVAIAISTMRGVPTYFGVMFVSPTLPPMM